MEIADRVAFVVGGASGMGRASAERLHAAGARIAIVDLEESAGADVAASVGGTFHAVDVTDHAAVEQALAAAYEAHGSCSIGVNTAGGSRGHGGLVLTDDGPASLEGFQYVVELNLVATFNVSRLEAWYMSRNEPDADGERGVIINTASVAAFEGQISQSAYAAAKAAVAGMSLPMARDLGRVRDPRQHHRSERLRHRADSCDAARDHRPADRGQRVPAPHGPTRRVRATRRRDHRQRDAERRHDPARRRHATRPALTGSEQESTCADSTTARSRAW